MKKFDTTGTANTGATTEALEGLLRRARNDGFTPAETEQIWSRLGTMLGATADRVGANSPTGSSGSVAGGAGGAQTIGLLLRGGGVVAAGLAAVGIASVALHRSPPVVAAGGAAAAAAANNSSSSRVVENAGVGTADTPVVNPLAGLVLQNVPRVVSPAPSPTPSPEKMDTPSRGSGDPRPASAKSAHPGIDKRGVDTTTESSAPPEATSQPAQPSLPPRAVPNEGSLLLRARRELTSDPADTLRLTEEHLRLFPTGTLGPEREVLAIEALVGLGRLSEARARFSGFRARFPQSPHLARLDGLVGR